jgi:N-glycosidase YbiA
VIDSFQGDNRWLSNFWPAQVVFEDVLYPSVEHAYQAAKTMNLLVRAVIAAQPTAGAAKRSGKLLPLRDDWGEVRLGVMEELLRKKFRHPTLAESLIATGDQILVEGNQFRHPTLAESLIATGDQILVEGNHWGDTFWGVCNAKGENHLGKLLMKIRAELKLNLTNSKNAV